MIGDERDYKLDISSLDSGQAPAEPAPPRPFLSVLFECCGVYQRIYRDADGGAYRARCPRCGTPVHFTVGQNGTTARFFRVS